MCKTCSELTESNGIELHPFYFTLGSIHVHEIEKGLTWDKDGYVRVLAATQEEAEALINSKFSYKWSMCYTERDWESDWF